MIGANICNFAIGICLWRLCCRAKETPTPTPSAPHMMMQAIITQPAVAPRTLPAPVQKPAKKTELHEATTQFPLTSPYPRKH